VNDLVEFLRARLDEDEQVAREAAEHGEGVYDSPMQATFWSPRVLAEVEAKRLIVERHRPISEPVEWPDDQTGKGEALVCSSCGNRDLDGWINWRPLVGEAGVFPDGVTPPYVLAPCETLRLLALPYAEHPDYRQEWRP
jgi:hypothetical protein